jgi:hypothetical protein
MASSLYWDDPDPRAAGAGTALDDAFERDLNGLPPLARRVSTSPRGGGGDDEDMPLIASAGPRTGRVGEVHLPPPRELLPLWVIIAYGAPNLAAASAV